MPSPQPAVVLLSGGLDSSVLLHHVAKELHCPAIHALSFNYGQRHDRELACATAQSNVAGTKVHRVMDITFMGTLIQAGSALIQGGADVNKGYHYRFGGWTDVHGHRRDRKTGWKRPLYLARDSDWSGASREVYSLLQKAGAHE